jgi:hypothetical protein
MPTKRTRRVHALSRLLSEQLGQKGARAEWIEEALIADLMTNGRSEIRVPISAFFLAAQEEQELELTVDEEAGVLVVRLAGQPTPAPAPTIPSTGA